jgi:5-methylthioadenosine/S-adenosylhomocysteine deaminase
MSNYRLTPTSSDTRRGHLSEHDGEARDGGGLSRRRFLQASGAGLAAGTLAGTGLAGTALAEDFERGHRRPPRGRRVLIKGGVVLTMDPTIGDFEQADVLIDGSKIAMVRPNIRAAAQVVDARGMIVMPGFVDTHHHQYETIQRANNADGNLQWAGANPVWPQEGYGTVVQSIWTTGRIEIGNDVIWDLGRSPYDPEDNYISELLASVSQINQGVTTGIDTSQSSHSPAHTDAMIEGLMDSGRRSLFVYSAGRSDTPGYEFPGSIGDSTRGLGRLRAQWFNSDDQLVTLGHQQAPPDGWLLARDFGAVIVNHNNSDGANIIQNADLLDSDIEQIHCARFLPEAYRLCADNGVHISIAVAIEMQMGHGTPPFQQCLDVGILPSLSADVDTNMTPNMFTLMRSGFTLQRALLHARALAGETNLPPLLTCYQVLEMATVAGAVSAGLGDKVGTLTPGKEADIILLNARALNTWPLNNAPGSVVTMMDTSNVHTVFIGGRLRKWRGQLVGVRVNRLLDQIEAARDRVLARIQSVPIPIDGLNSAPGYTPRLLASCCSDGPHNIGRYDAQP